MLWEHRMILNYNNRMPTHVILSNFKILKFVTHMHASFIRGKLYESLFKNLKVSLCKYFSYNTKNIQRWFLILFQVHNEHYKSFIRKIRMTAFFMLVFRGEQTPTFDYPNHSSFFFLF